MKTKGTLLIILMSVFLLSACGEEKFKAEYSLEIEDFEHINHRGETISLNSLKGQPWLGMFVFTKCNTVCPPMTFNMTQVQEKLKEKGIENYRIVGFSIDPDTDTPQVLSNYLENYNVPDESKWNLLTDYSQKYIEQFARKSTRVLVKDDPNSDQVIHGTEFFLVDKDGILIKRYSGYEENIKDVPFDTIVSDIEKYIDEFL